MTTPAADDAPAQLLPWDTDFFGVRIARAHGHHLTPERVAALDAWCAAEQIACLYLLAAVDDPVTARLAEAHGYHLVDLRLTLERSLADVAVTDLPPGIRPFMPADVPTLEAIARVSYTDSRYYFDPHIPRPQADAFYATWIRNSTNGSGFADAVLVATDPGAGDFPLGFISCKRRDPVGHIGLVGVAEQARGRSLGRALLASALVWFAAQGMTSVQVVTQGRNIAAQRLYQRGGFLSLSLQTWYHKWYLPLA